MRTGAWETREACEKREEKGKRAEHEKKGQWRGKKTIMWKIEEYREKGMSLGKTRKCGKNTVVVVRKKIWCKGKKDICYRWKTIAYALKKE